MSDTKRCPLCNELIPVVSPVLGKAIGTVVLSTLGVKHGATPLERLLFSILGLGVGHLIDAIAAEMMHSVCRACSARAT